MLAFNQLVLKTTNVALMVLSFISIGSNGQSVSDCGTSFGCLRYPGSCNGADCDFLVKWVLVTATNTTQWHIYSKISRISTNDVWAGIAFSQDQLMGEDNAFICRYTAGYSTGDVLSYYNSPGPTLIGNGTVGIANVSITLTDSTVLCSFIRDQSSTVTDTYFDTASNQFYILAAYGPLTYNAISYHSDKVFSDRRINVLSTEDVSASRDNSSVKAHGSLMIIAWIIFASTGLILMRYFKFTLEKPMLFNRSLCFVLHRSFMTLTTLLSLIGFLLIFSTYHWYWVKADNNWTNTQYTHSLFGAAVLILSGVQILMGTFRAHKESENRALFEKAHKLTGFFTFFCAMVAIYIGTMSSRLDLGDLGWILVMVWTLWFIIVLTILEVLKLIFTEDDEDEEESDLFVDEEEEMPKPFKRNSKFPTTASASVAPKEQESGKSKKKKSSIPLIRKVILICHIIVSVILALILIVFISVRS